MQRTSDGAGVATKLFVLSAVSHSSVFLYAISGGSCGFSQCSLSLSYFESLPSHGLGSEVKVSSEHNPGFTFFHAFAVLSYWFQKFFLSCLLPVFPCSL